MGCITHTFAADHFVLVKVPYLPRTHKDDPSTNQISVRVFCASSTLYTLPFVFASKTYDVNQTLSIFRQKRSSSPARRYLILMHQRYSLASRIIIFQKNDTTHTLL